jgi:hypothetical protein
MTYVPEGLTLGYPGQIDFSVLKERVGNMEAELRDIIEKRKCSKFADELTALVGERGTTTPMDRLNLTEKVMVSAMDVFLYIASLFSQYVSISLPF